MGKIIDISEVLLEIGLSASVTDEERAIVSTAITRAEGAIKRHLRYDPVQRTRTEFYPQMSSNYSPQPFVWETEGNEAIQRLEAQAASSELQLHHIPVRSITSINVDYDARSGTRSGAFAATTLKTEGTDYWPNYNSEDDDGNSICQDGIIRNMGAWPTTPGTVKIVYVAGYSIEELHGQKTLIDASPIIDAVLQESVRRAKKAFVTMKQTSVGFVAGNIVSERLGDYSYQLGGGGGSVSETMFGGKYDLMPETYIILESFLNWGWGITS